MATRILLQVNFTLVFPSYSDHFTHFCNKVQLQKHLNGSTLAQIEVLDPSY